MQLALVLVVLGWIVTHYLTLRAQGIQQRTAVQNEARLAITDVVRRTQKWLDSHLKEVPTTTGAGNGDVEPPGWAVVFEEYWAVFPKLRWVHPDLLDRYERMSSQIGVESRRNDSEYRMEAVELIGLFDDVLILVQGWALSPLFRERVPRRTVTTDRPFIREEGRKLSIQKRGSGKDRGE